MSLIATGMRRPISAFARYCGDPCSIVQRQLIAAGGVSVMRSSPKPIAVCGVDASHRSEQGSMSAPPTMALAGMVRKRLWANAQIRVDQTKLTAAPRSPIPVNLTSGVEQAHPGRYRA